MICIASSKLRLNISPARNISPISDWISGTPAYVIPFRYCPHWFLVCTIPVMKYIVQEALPFNTLQQSDILFSTYYKKRHTRHRTTLIIHQANVNVLMWVQIYLRLRRTNHAVAWQIYLALSNRVNAQQEFSLAFTAHQELIFMSSFRADILPAQIVFTRHEEDHAIFCVSNCNAYLNSFRYSSPICSVSNLPVLRYVIRLSFYSGPAPPFALFNFFLHIMTNTVHGSAQYSW